MNKEELIALMEARDRKYPEFVAAVRREVATTRWGSGVGEPYTVEPYRMEVLGIKPGKMLKKAAEPGPRKHCYSYDAAGQVIHRVEYEELGGSEKNRAWIHADDFYEYRDGQILKFVFGGVFGDGEDAKLTRVACIKFAEGRVVSLAQLERRQFEYTETYYKYNDNAVSEIRIRWPEGPYPDRLIEVAGSGDEVKLFAIRDGARKQIYPL